MYRRVAYLCWIIAAGCVLPALAQETSIPADGSDPLARPTEVGIRFTPGMARAMAQQIAPGLFQHYGMDEEKLPEEYSRRDDSVERKAVDYIAGMTDNYALRMAEEVARGADF